MFPFQSDLEIEPGFKVPYQRVLESVYPLLTPERRERIETVVRHRTFSVTPVLENIHDRGNISAVLRSAEAFGLGEVHVIESVRSKESQRTTAGAEKWVERRRWKSTAECLERLRVQGRRIYVTSLSPRSVPIAEIDFSVPSALVLGNEKDGASREMIAAADAEVIIPMYGFVQSFNISVAAALSFYQMVCDREKRIGRHGDLNEKEMEILKAVYALRTLDSASKILARERRLTADTAGIEKSAEGTL